MKISKRDAANRQLDEAIRMLFEQRDPVAVHTLVGAATLIFTDLVEAQVPEKSWDTMAQNDNNLDKKSYFQIMRKTQNFIKHAKSDADDVLEFDTTEAPTLVMLSTLNNGELGGTLSREQSFFQLWYLAAHHKSLEWESSDIPNAINVFGDISQLTEQEKISKGLEVWKRYQAT